MMAQEQDHGSGIVLPAAYERRLASEQQELLGRAFAFWRGETPSFQSGFHGRVQFLRRRSVRHRSPARATGGRGAASSGSSWDALLDFLAEDRAEPDPWNYVPREKRVCWRDPLED